MSQCADAIQELLARKIEGIMTKRQLRVLADQKAEDINVTQERNRRSRASATRTRILELARLGITLSELPSCG